MLGFVVLALSVVSLWLSALLGRVISRPLLALADAAKRVSERHDYQVRVAPGGRDEVGRVTEAFNTMVARVQQREKALASALRVRDEFLSVASHELRTPIASVLLQAGALERSAARGELAPAPLARRAALIQRQTERLEQLVSTLLDVSRIMAGRLTLAAERVDLTAVARDAVEALRTEIANARTEVVVDAPAPVYGEAWDRLRLEQVATNLLGNALKYGEGKPVHVTVGATDGWARLTVRDEGIGIAPEHFERIFDRFERAVSERHYGGFGLGLWIVREIVYAMGGKVAVESAPRRGATFTVELPRGRRGDQTRDDRR
jgi:signal transduction histidine kinase